MTNLGISIQNNGNAVPVVAAVSVDALTGLPAVNIPKHDHIALGYTGANLTSVVYKLGGSGGTTVATLTLGYDGSDNLISVDRS